MCTFGFLTNAARAECLVKRTPLPRRFSFSDCATDTLARWLGRKGKSARAGAKKEERAHDFRTTSDADISLSLRASSGRPIAGTKTRGKFEISIA